MATACVALLPPQCVSTGKGRRQQLQQQHQLPQQRAPMPQQQTPPSQPVQYRPTQQQQQQQQQRQQLQQQQQQQQRHQMQQPQLHRVHTPPALLSRSTPASATGPAGGSAPVGHARTPGTIHFAAPKALAQPQGGSTPSVVAGPPPGRAPETPAQARQKVRREQIQRLEELQQQLKSLVPQPQPASQPGQIRQQRPPQAPVQFQPQPRQSSQQQSHTASSQHRRGISQPPPARAALLVKGQPSPRGEPLQRPSFGIDQAQQQQQQRQQQQQQQQLQRQQQAQPQQSRCQSGPVTTTPTAATPNTTTTTPNTTTAAAAAALSSNMAPMTGTQSAPARTAAGAPAQQQGGPGLQPWIRPTLSSPAACEGRKLDLPSPVVIKRKGKDVSSGYSSNQGSSCETNTPGTAGSSTSTALPTVSNSSSGSSGSSASASTSMTPSSSSSSSEKPAEVSSKARAPAGRGAGRTFISVIAPGAGTFANSAVYQALAASKEFSLATLGRSQASYDRYPASWPDGCPGSNLETFARQLISEGSIQQAEALILGSRGGQVVLPYLWKSLGSRVPPAIVINAGCAMNLPAPTVWPQAASTFLLMGGLDTFKQRFSCEEYVADAKSRVPKGSVSTAILFVKEMGHMPTSELLGAIVQPMLRTIIAWKTAKRDGGDEVALAAQRHLKDVVAALERQRVWSGRLLFTTATGHWEEWTFGRGRSQLKNHHQHHHQSHHHQTHQHPQHAGPLVESSASAAAPSSYNQLSKSYFDRLKRGLTR